MKITRFQQKVLNYISKIPKGEVRSYKEVAKGINHPKAIRAVATACKRNPSPFKYLVIELLNQTVILESILDLEELKLRLNC